MLAGDRAAALYAQPQNVDGKLHGALFLASDAAVVENERMQISVAGMKDVGHAQSRGGAPAFDFAENFGQSGARNDAVLHDVVGRNASHSGEGSLPAFPDEGALGFRLRDADFPGAASRADRADLLDQVRDLD